MSSSSTRLNRYLTIAAGGAVGLAVSPLHGDIQHFSGQINLSLGEGINTFTSVSHRFWGGGLSWSLGGIRSASSHTSSSSWSNGSSFIRTSHFDRRSSIYWTAGASAIGSRLFEADELIGLDAMQGGGDYWALIHSQYYEGTNRVTIRSNYSGWSYESDSDSERNSTGMMAGGDRGFLALSFNLNGETVYGWADIRLSYYGKTMTVYSWAFEDSGGAIVAGQTEGGGTPVPGLGGLAALACGAAGMRRKRDRVA